MKEPQSSLATIVDDSRLRAMAPLIDAQFAKSKPAMAEIVKLWGMLRLFQEEAERVYSHVSINPPSRSGGRPSHPWDLKVLFEKYLPNVEQRSAYRLFACGEFIAETFEVQFLPAALQKKIELPKLATSTPKELEKIDRRLPKKQRDLFEFAEGGSQKSWLDQFSQTSRGGNQYDRGGGKGKRRGITQAQLEKFLRDGWIQLGKSLRIYTKEQTFVFLNDGQLDALLEILSSAEAEMRLWRNKTKSERDDIFAAVLAKAAKQQNKK